MSASKHPSRHAALTAMIAVIEEGVTLDEALIATDRDLPPEIRAEARRLATGAFRFASRSDRIVSPYLRRKPGTAVLSIFRLALFELNEAGTPAHAAVDVAVSLTTAKQKGLVNAVLRNVLRDAPEWRDVPNPLPKWLRKRLVKAWGESAVAVMETVQRQTPPVDLTAKGPESILPEGAHPLPTGSHRLRDAGRVSGLPGFEKGDWWVQDAAAALPARLLEAGPGMRVLDLCAAPGGKTMQLASMGATVTALDISKRRMGRVEENLARTGLSAELVVADALEWEPDAPFDAVLLDAPCSATGTLRRHPELPWARDGSEIAALVELQARLIDRALGFLAPGGRLVFCTCSLLPEEGEEQVREALARHAGLVAVLPDAAWMHPGWLTETGLRIRPDHWAERGGFDGFFIAALDKPA
jgi:16S rRNA (cytosine967-C5)-methyltransferase